MSRQLAAILFSDVVGYTSLMGSNERVALQVLEFNRGIHKRLTEKYGGRYIKEMGDGTLLSFPSASAAVECALEIQKLKEGEAYELKMGIHLGEVVFENEDVFGDGVNIASRIESLSIPDSILISQNVYEELANKPEIQTAYLGDFLLKNDKKPRAVYAIDHPLVHVPDEDQLPRPALVDHNAGSLLNTRNLLMALIVVIVGFWLYRTYVFEPSIRSDQDIVLAVFPFTNNDRSLFYLTGPELASGLSQKLSTNNGMTTIRSSTVIATSDLLTKASLVPRDSRAVLLDSLKATHYVVGSINKNLKVEIYNRASRKPIRKIRVKLQNPSDMIDELCKIITYTLGVQGNDQWRYDQRDPEVAEMYVRAISLWEMRAHKDSFYLAIDKLNEALQIDDMDPDVNALLALCYANGLERKYFPVTEVNGVKLNIENHASAALKVNRDQPNAHLAIGTLRFLNGQHDQARSSYQQAHNIAPQSGITSQAIGEHALYLGDPVNALQYMRLARAADPHDHTIMRYLGWCEMANGFANASKQINEQMVKEFDGEEYLNYYQWVDHMLKENYTEAQGSYPDSLPRFMRLLFDGLLYTETADTAKYQDYLDAAQDPLSIYVARYVTLIWNIHNGSPEQIAEGQRQYKELYDSDGFTLNWFVQTYPFKCFNSFRTDPGIVAYAASNNITYKPHPYWKIQREVRD